MAFISGSSTDVGALALLIHTQLTANTALVANNQQWVVVWGTPPTNSQQQDTTVVYRGVGDGTDNIYMGIRYALDRQTQTLSIFYRGFTGVTSTALDWDDHVEPSTIYKNTFQSDVQIDYWISITSFRLCARFEFNVYQQDMYCGLGLSLADPDEYPYPYYVSAGQFNVSTDNYLDTTLVDNSSFIDANRHGSIYTINGSWSRDIVVANYSHEDSDLAPVVFNSRLLRDDDFTNLEDSEGGVIIEQCIISHKPDTSQGSASAVFILQGVNRPYGNIINRQQITDSDSINHRTFSAINNSYFWSLEES